MAGELTGSLELDRQNGCQMTKGVPRWGMGSAPAELACLQLFILHAHLLCAMPGDMSGVTEDTGPSPRAPWMELGVEEPWGQEAKEGFLEEVHQSS